MSPALSRQEMLLGTGRFPRAQLRAALLLALLPMLLIVRINIFMRQRADFTSVDTYAMAQSLMVAVTVLVLLITPRSRLLMARLRGNSMGLLMVFYGICGLSALWSKIPAYSLYRAVEALVQFLAIWVALSCFRTFATIERAGLLLAIFALLVDFVGRVKLSGIGNLRTNTYSATAGMIFCYAFGEYVGSRDKRRRRLMIAMLVSAPLVVLGQCSTSNVALVAGVLMVGLFKPGAVRATTILLLVLLLLMVLTGMHERIAEAAFGLLFPGKTHAQVAGMSGRVGMWEWALEKFSHKPLLGHGFLVTGRLERNALTMHNVFIGSLLDTGLLGTVTVAGAFLLAVVEMARRAGRRRAGLIGCFGAFSAGFVNCMGVPFLATHWTAATFGFAAIAGIYIHAVLNPPPPASRSLPAARRADAAAAVRQRCLRPELPPVPRERMELRERSELHGC